MLLFAFVALTALASADGPSEGEKAAAVEPKELSPKGAEGSSQGRGFRRRAGYLHISPAGLAFGASMTYVWGMSGGYHVPFGRWFAFQGGLFIDHHIELFYEPITTPGSFLSPRHDLVVGAELRPGAGTQRFFGYPLIRLGAEFPIYPYGIGFDGANPLFSLGGGAQFLVHDHVSIGGEPAFDFPSALSEFSIFTFRARVFVAVVF